MLREIKIPNQLDDIQLCIDKLVAWYNLKYSDEYIYKDTKESLETLELQFVSMMSFEKMKKNFSTFEYNLFFNTRSDISILNKYLVEMAGCGLIHHKNTNPFYGYYRVQKMFSEFNEQFQWSLAERIYDYILEKSYSPNNIEVMKALKLQQETQIKQPKKKKLFHFLRRYFFYFIIIL